MEAENGVVTEDRLHLLLGYSLRRRRFAEGSEHLFFFAFVSIQVIRDDLVWYVGPSSGFDHRDLAIIIEQTLFYFVLRVDPLPLVLNAVLPKLDELAILHVVRIVVIGPI